MGLQKGIDQIKKLQHGNSQWEGAPWTKLDRRQPH